MGGAEEMKQDAGWVGPTTKHLRGDPNGFGGEGAGRVKALRRGREEARGLVRWGEGRAIMGRLGPDPSDQDGGCHSEGLSEQGPSPYDSSLRNRPWGDSHTRTLRGACRSHSGGPDHDGEGAGAARARF